MDRKDYLNIPITMDMIKAAYEGYVFPKEAWIPEKSGYNHNYYIGVFGEEIYAESDDDNSTDYYYGNCLFAESFCSEGDVLHVIF